MKQIKSLLLILIIVLHFSTNAQSQEINLNEPVTYSHLMRFAKKSIDESLSEGDYFSLIAEEIVFAEFDATKKDKILEIKCTIEKHDGSIEEYSTVHRDIVRADNKGFKMDNSFFLLQDIPLSNVKNIKLEISVKSINEKQSKLFAIAANLLDKATSSNPAIQTVTDLLNVEADDSEPEVPVFNAWFYVPNNYINFFQINKGLKLPLLKPDTPLSIAFESTSKNVPKNYLKRFANLIVKDAFVDKENIGGVLVLKATKKTPRPIAPVVQKELLELYRIVKSQEIDKLKDAIITAKSTLNIAYSDELEKRSSAYKSANFYLSLVDCYEKFINSDIEQNKKVFYKKFESWVSDKIDYFAIDDYLLIPIKGMYKPSKNDDSNERRIVDFYIPTNLPNDLLIQCFVLQKLMHSNFNGRIDREIIIDNLTHTVEFKE